MFPSIIPVLSQVILDSIGLDTGSDETILALRLDLDEMFVQIGLRLDKFE